MTTQREVELIMLNLTQAGEQIVQLQSANAALEAEVVRLRGALEIASGFIRRTNDEYGVDSDESEIEQCVQSTLSTQFTPTALNELIEKVEKMTIERCAIAAWMHYAAACNLKGLNPNDTFLGAWISSAEIRALPTGQIKLEELLK